MLVLSRKNGESIVIGENIVIEILEVSQGKIRIGIAAPKDVRVIRGELIPHQKSAEKKVKPRPTNRVYSTGVVGQSKLTTVADLAWCRLRELRDQTNLAGQVSESTEHFSESTGQCAEVAETLAEYNLAEYKVSDSASSNYPKRSRLDGMLADGTRPNPATPWDTKHEADTDVRAKRSLANRRARIVLLPNADHDVNLDDANLYESYWRTESLNQYADQAFGGRSFASDELPLEANDAFDFLSPFRSTK